MICDSDVHLVLDQEHDQNLRHLKAIAYCLDNMKRHVVAYQEKGSLDMGAFVEIQDLESCACTEEHGLAMSSVLEFSHLLIVLEMMLASYFLHISDSKMYQLPTKENNLY